MSQPKIYVQKNIFQKWKQNKDIFRHTKAECVHHPRRLILQEMLLKEVLQTKGKGCQMKIWIDHWSYFDVELKLHQEVDLMLFIILFPRRRMTRAGIEFSLPSGQLAAGP